MQARQVEEGNLEDYDCREISWWSLIIITVLGCGVPTGLLTRKICLLPIAKEDICKNGMK